MQVLMEGRWEDRVGWASGGSLENDRIKLKMLLPPPLFPEEAWYHKISGFQRVQQRCLGMKMTWMPRYQRPLITVSSLRSLAQATYKANSNLPQCLTFLNSPKSLWGHLTLGRHRSINSLRPERECVQCMHRF